MKPGSVLVFDHAIFHGASDNHSDAWRLGLQVSYHVGWVRPYTNWFRSIPIEEVREFPEKLRDILGCKTWNSVGGGLMQPAITNVSRQMSGGENRMSNPPIREKTCLSFIGQSRRAPEDGSKIPIRQPA